MKLIFILLICLPVLVFSDSDHERAKQLYEQGEILSLQEILERSKGFIQGQILEVELEREHGKLIYEIEIINDQNSIIELLFDAKTGQLLNSEPED